MITASNTDCTDDWYERLLFYLKKSIMKNPFDNFIARCKWTYSLAKYKGVDTEKVKCKYHDLRNNDKKWFNKKNIYVFLTSIWISHLISQKKNVKVENKQFAK